MKALQPADALDLRFYDPDAGAHTTIREYFKLQLAALWAEGESFSGKRPFGNSGWEGVLEGVLINHHCVPGVIDTEESDDGYIEVLEVNHGKYDEFVQKMIEAL